MQRTMPGEVAGSHLVSPSRLQVARQSHILEVSHIHLCDWLRSRRRGRPRTAWMDNIKTWTGLPVEESVRMTEDRDKWKKYVRGVAKPRIEDG